MTIMLEGKFVMITGAASGIGAAAARVFAGYGALVACLDRDQSGAERVAQALPGAIAIGCDVSDPAAVCAAVMKVVRHFGRIDGAFNNAGIEQMAGRMAPIANIPLADYDAVMAVNLRGIMICLQAELAQMQRGAAIVNTARVMAVVGAPGFGAYAASKHGVMGLTRAAALDYAAAGIRVNAVLPGAVRTPMLTERAFVQNPGYEAMAQSVHPIGRMAEPEEIAEAAAWLLSDLASFVTGIALPVDGGLTAM